MISFATASQEVAQYYQLYSADNFFYLNQSGCYTGEKRQQQKQQHTVVLDFFF
jgi:hypothetical protein